MAIFQFMTAKGYAPEGDGDPAFPSAFCAPTPRLRRAGAVERRTELHGQREQRRALRSTPA